MRLCSFCGLRPAGALAVGRLRLCGACCRELCAVEPGDPRYPWFLSAVSRCRAAWSEKA